MNLPTRLLAGVAALLGLFLAVPGSAQDLPDPGPAPVVAVHTVDAIAAEADPRDIAVFELRREGALDRPVTVFFRTGGVAVRGVDFALIPEGEFGWCDECDRVPAVLEGGELHLPAGAARLRFGARAIPDKAIEGDEGFQLELITPPVCPGCPVPYVVATPDAARGLVRDTPAPGGPYLLLRQPVDGAVYRMPAAVRLEAEAFAGADDSFQKVEFLANGVLVAVSDLSCGVCAFVLPPGGVLRHVAGWSVGAAGTYEVTARAVSVAGVERISPPVKILVEPAPDRPVVTVTASQPATSEPAPEIRIIPGRFTFRRMGGDPARPVRVAYRLSGTALNGVDYVALDGDLTLEAGEVSRDVLVIALGDAVVEPAETVVVTLKESDAYRPGIPASAVVTIADTTRPGGARVTVTAPRAGEVLPSGAPIALRALAIDPAGHVPEAEFLVDGERVAESRIVFIREPDPGTPIEHEGLWEKPVAGVHRLVVAGRTSNGMRIESAPVEFVVRDGVPVPWVVRDLPDRYVPGAGFEVLLVARPKDGVQAYAVEDRPPAGWQVGGVSGGGEFDVATGRVKFGPFTDSLARELRYKVEPPAGATGRGEFAGIGSADGTDTPVGGDRIVEPVRRHPADREPADNRITVAEVTAYAAAWRSGAAWPTGPSPVPVGHMTRAAFLWKKGEAYRFDPAAGPEPLGWVPIPATMEPAVLATADAAAQDQAPIPPPPGGFGLARWSDAGDPAARTLEVQVLPVPGTLAHAVEQFVGPGVAVTDVSDGGRHDAATGWLRWGPFLDDQPRRLTAVVSGPARPSAPGRVSCDGRERPVMPWGGPVPVSGSPAPEIAQVVPRADGSVELAVHDGTPLGACDLEVSTDLRTWRVVRELPSGSDWSLAVDSDASGDDVRFYRIRRR